MNEKKLQTLKEYTKFDSYKVGNGILREIENKTTEEMSRDKIMIAHIYNTLYEIICKDDVSPELASNEDVKLRAGDKNDRLNETLSSNDESTKDLVNRIFREKLCRNTTQTSHATRNAKRVRKSPSRIRHSNRYRDVDFEREPRDNAAESNKSNIKKNQEKLNRIKNYIHSENQNENAIVRDASDDDNDHSDRNILSYDDNTKAEAIQSALHELICKDGLSPELNSYQDVILKAEKREKYHETLKSNDDITVGIINKVLRETICKKGIEHTISKSVHKQTNYNNMISGYYNDHFAANNEVDKSEHAKIDKYSSKTINKYNTEEDNFNNDSRDNEKDDIELKNDSIDEDVSYDRNGDLFDDDDKDQNDLDGDGGDAYKTVLRSSCWREGVKNCKRSCKYALRDTCDEYMCSRRMKRSFKKKCKKYCKD